jgi:hypothetical protein
MDNPFESIRVAMQQAREARRAVAQHANSMASLLVDSLREVDTEELRRLKRALRFFDATRGKWRTPR